MSSIITQIKNGKKYQYEVTYENGKHVWRKIDKGKPEGDNLPVPVVGRGGGTAEKKEQTSENAAAHENRIVSVRSTEATQHVMECDKVTKALFDTLKNFHFYERLKQDVEVNTGKSNAKVKKKVYTLVNLNVDKLKEAIQNHNITLSNNDIVLNPFTRAVHDAVVSIYLAGNSHFTEEMIYQEMTGYARKDNAGDETLKKIHAELQKLMYTAISIDTTPEANAWNIQQFKFKGDLLPLSWTMIKINGKVCEAWTIHDKPPLLPLFAMAERKNQISRYDIKLLDTGMSATPENIVLRNYLLEQIQVMKNKKGNRNTTILYKTIYEFLGVYAPTEATAETKRRRIRSKVKNILDEWIKKEFIQGYKEVIEGRKIISLHIQLRK